MSVYLRKGRGYIYDFVLGGKRYTSRYHRTKAAAKRAEALRREELQYQRLNPEETTPTDITFFDLVSRRLDHIQAHNSERHYREILYLARRWLKYWPHSFCAEMTRDNVESFILKRSKVSKVTANKDLRQLRATFNFGIKKGWIDKNPTAGLEFLPESARIKYVPPLEDIYKVLEVADQETKDYLVTILDTMGRMSEINQLKWEDVDLSKRSLILYTRKKKGGHLRPRKIPMTSRLFELLRNRYENRERNVPWVFWHDYYSSKDGKPKRGPYKDRKKIMRTLCRKAGVRYFRYHALRHAGASLLDDSNVPMGAIQRLLGHENRQTTEIYLHSIGQSERDAIQVLESVFWKKSQPKSQPKDKARLRLVT